MDPVSAKRTTLILIAAIIWSAVALGLATAAIIWFTHLTLQSGYLAMLAAAGLLVGAAKYKFMFKGLVEKNIGRIYALSPHKERVCVFAFQNVQSYLIVLVMMALGYIIRTSGLTKVALAPAYLAIATALFLGSLRYFNFLRQRSV